MSTLQEQSLSDSTAQKIPQPAPKLSKNFFWLDLRNILLLILAVGISFAPCFTAGFVHWDDDLHLLNNPLVKEIPASNIAAVFQTLVNKTYIPLTVISFQIEHLFYGLNPFVYHLNNITLHALVCLTIYGMFCRMGFDRRIVFLTALIFAIHPMHVESVAWVTQRKDVLYALLYALSMWQYWQFLTYRKKRSYWLSLAFGALSIFAKPMALSLPLTLLVFDWYYQGRVVKQAVFNKIPYLLVMVPVAWITYQANARVPVFDTPESLLIWAWSATFYIKKFFTPFVLLPLYQLPQPVSILNPSYFSSVLMLAAAPFALFYLRRDKLFVLAVWFYALSTFFLWRYDDAVDVTIVGDRFMYLPSLGICLWLARLAINQLNTRKPLPRIVVSVIMIAMMAQTHHQSRIWQNDVALWDHEIKHEQRSALAYNSRGAALSRNNDQESALRDLDKAIELNPEYTLAFYNRGRVYTRQDKRDLALADFDAALRTNPKHVNSLIDRGILLSRQEKYEDALADLNTAQSLEPENARLYNNRGIVYKNLGKWNEALEDYTKAIALNPRSASSFVNRSEIWLELGNPTEAFNDLEKARQLGVGVNAGDLEKLKSLAGQKI